MLHKEITQRSDLAKTSKGNITEQSKNQKGVKKQVYAGNLHI